VRLSQAELHRRFSVCRLYGFSMTFYSVVVTIVESQVQMIGSISSSMLQEVELGEAFSDSA
jgi:hypothetical protein